MRIGIGYDSHRLVEGRRLVLGGVEIPFEKGLEGHSDADVLCHAIIDSILGALGLGDIGKHFPDSDERWTGASSIDLLARVVTLMRERGFDMVWVDSIIVAERPKLGPYIEMMKKSIAQSGILLDSMNIKATTNEGMGFVGKGDGIAAQAVCLLKPGK